MEKKLIKKESDLLKAVEYFGIEYKETIIESVEKFPCILIGNYCEDWEMGNMYSFICVYESDFNESNANS